MRDWNWSKRIQLYVEHTGYPAAMIEGQDGRLSGTWFLGQNYVSGNNYHGAYPPNLLKRLRGLLPEFHRQETLHLCSGKVIDKDFPGVKVDINPLLKPDIVDDAHTLTNTPVEQFRLVLCDPPYTAEDADRYGVPMVKRNVILRTLAARLRPGSLLCWTDMVLPMFKRTDYRIVGAIGAVRSTNHRFRMVTFFEKL